MSQTATAHMMGRDMMRFWKVAKILMCEIKNLAQYLLWTFFGVTLIETLVGGSDCGECVE